MADDKPAEKRRPNFRVWRQERRQRRALERVARAEKIGALTKEEADEYREEISIGDFMALWELIKELIEWIREWLRNR